jgi:hypothetical protein
MTNFTVHRNKRYRATIRLGLLEQLAGNAAIADALQEAGFTDVTVEGAGATSLPRRRGPRGLECAAARADRRRVRGRGRVSPTVSRSRR